MNKYFKILNLSMFLLLGFFAYSQKVTKHKEHITYHPQSDRDFKYKDDKIEICVRIVRRKEDSLVCFNFDIQNLSKKAFGLGTQVLSTPAARYLKSDTFRVNNFSIGVDDVTDEDFKNVIIIEPGKRINFNDACFKKMDLLCGDIYIWTDVGKLLKDLEKNGIKFHYRDEDSLRSLVFTRYGTLTLTGNYFCLSIDSISDNEKLFPYQKLTIGY